MFERCSLTCAAVQEAYIAVTNSRIAPDMQTSVFWQSHQVTRVRSVCAYSEYQHAHAAQALKTPYDGQASWLFKREMVRLFVEMHLILDMQS